MKNLVNLLQAAQLALNDVKVYSESFGLSQPVNLLRVRVIKFNQRFKIGWPSPLIFCVKKGLDHGRLAVTTIKFSRGFLSQPKFLDLILQSADPPLSLDV